MPGVHYLGRRWNFASDDLFYPGLIELVFRIPWLISQAVFYSNFNDFHKCPDSNNLNTYYIGLFSTLATIMFIQILIVFISAQGTITNTKPRKHITKLLSIRLFLILFEISWSIVGSVWVFNNTVVSCSPISFATVFLQLIFSLLSLMIIINAAILLFDPMANVDKHDIKKKVDKIERYYLLCCRLGFQFSKKSEGYKNSFEQSIKLLSTLFTKSADLTYTDVAAGFMLINERTLPQFSRGLHDRKAKNRIDIDQIPSWMNITEAAHFIRYASAVYILNKDKEKFLLRAKVKESDVLHTDVKDELFLSPFAVFVDHFKKTIVISIRGTSSISDIVADLTATYEYFEVEGLERQKSHNGIIQTSESIYQIITKQNILVNAFQKNPNYNLLVTGHSLGAGASTLLSLKLRNDYPNVRCICYCPPGSIVSKELAEITKSFVLSVVVGDDIIPRLGVYSIHSLKADIIRQIWEKSDPKYKIYWNYSFDLSKRKLLNKNSMDQKIKNISKDTDLEDFESESRKKKEMVFYDLKAQNKDSDNDESEVEGSQNQSYRRRRGIQINNMNFLTEIDEEEDNVENASEIKSMTKFTDENEEKINKTANVEKKAHRKKSVAFFDEKTINSAEDENEEENEEVPKLINKARRKKAIVEFGNKQEVGRVEESGTTGDIPDTTGDIIDTTGDIPDTTGDIPDTTGDIPDTTGDIPDTTGDIPDTTGDIPDTTGDFPDTTEDIPDTTGYDALDATEDATDDATEYISKMFKEKFVREARRKRSIFDIEEFKFEAPSEEIETKEEAYKLIEVMKNYVKNTYPQLFLPGNIIYIYRVEDTENKSFFRSVCSKIKVFSKSSKKKVGYSFRWAQYSEFCRILLSNRMIGDHKSGHLESAFSSIVEKKIPTQENV